MRLDHLAIAAETLEEGVAWAEAKFGTTFGQGGTHERYGTHNRLLGLDGGLYLEVIAVDPEGQSKGPRWFGLDSFSGPPRLTNWICEPADFESGLKHGMESVPMERGDFRWDMGVPRDGALPLGGVYPTVLRWHTDEPPGTRLASSGFELERLVVSGPTADQIAHELDGVLSDPRVSFETAPKTALSAIFRRHTTTVTL